MGRELGEFSWVPEKSREIAQSIKCLSWKHKVPSSVPQNPHEKAGYSGRYSWSQHWGGGDKLGLTGWQVQSYQQSPSQWEGLSQQIKQGRCHPKNDIPDWSLLPHAHAYMYRYTHTTHKHIYMYTHIHAKNSRRVIGKCVQRESYLGGMERKYPNIHCSFQLSPKAVLYSPVVNSQWWTETATPAQVSKTWMKHKIPGLVNIWFYIWAHKPRDLNSISPCLPTVMSHIYDAESGEQTEFSGVTCLRIWVSWRGWWKLAACLLHWLLVSLLWPNTWQEAT